MGNPGAPLTFAALAVLAFVVAGCGGDDGGGGSGESADTTAAAKDEGTTQADTSTTAAPATPEEQAIAAYERAWAAEFEALNPPNPEHPALSESFTGVAAQSVVEIIVAAQDDGHYTVGSMQTNPEAVSVTADKVLLRDCTIEDSTSYDMATDAVLEQGPYPPRSREVEVVNQGGTWRVSLIRTLEESCTPG
ncbi:MAG TPA: hypothetical protein VKD21_08905 [Acidimicrobiales bacterium]|nr:hypothetical protein [Acidimicrobiales bacterium]